jgi:adenosylhomocysteine nucleosidase
LWAETGADAVEMESGIIRAGCAARGIPSATLRVISDSAGDELPFDFGTMLTADDRLDFGKLLLRILGSPGKIPSLLRLQRNVALAGRRLAEVLVEAAAGEGNGKRRG